MKIYILYLVISLICLFSSKSICQTAALNQISDYIDIINNKKIAVVANQSSFIGETHIIDTLLSLDIDIKYIFTPEHGLNGNYDAGEEVENSIYKNIPVISLYGDKKYIEDSFFEFFEIVLFDLQDVGVRFYTYISTLHYVMESCAKNNTQLVVLDRPNPHLQYVDGPVLDMNYKSFVGMHPVPVVYGMTIGEYSKMINGEKWLDSGFLCDLIVIKIKNYKRSDIIEYNVPPSPNLTNLNSILLYPSLCFFEGTIISVGRGTNLPFQIYGAPYFNTNFIFKPSPNLGSKYPKFNGQKCYGYNLSEYSESKTHLDKINLNFLINAFRQSPNKKQKVFFNSFFDKLAGNGDLKQKIIEGWNEDKIRKSWESSLIEFSLIRKKYLMYD